MGLIDRIVGSMYGRARKRYYRNRYTEYRRRYDIHQDFRFAGTDIRFYGNGQIKIGPLSYFGTNSTIQTIEGCNVIIGSHCQISHNVRIYTSSADPNQDFTKERSKRDVMGDVVIGDGVWIGANAFINPGVVIGHNSVVGANSVVTKNVAENAIVGGVPARLIRFKE